ncbi:MAG TPA: hypothetical protein VJL28_12465 [Gemmatimonadaceae bacterium]|nr:hypothetical protein [Gemmatimonadaceae bacterium]
MQTITTATAALALGIEAKALDNLLNSGANELLPPGERGRSRRIPLDVLELITLVLLLKRDLGVPVTRAVEIAQAIHRAPHGEIRLGSLAVLRFDVARLRDVLQRAIADALETVVPPRRGRPPARTRPS